MDIESLKQLIKKLNYKDPKMVFMYQLPQELQPLAAEWSLQCDITNEWATVGEGLEFALFFVTQLAEIEAIAEALEGKMLGDTVLWFVYPKGTSKKYRCDFNRDTGWQALSNLGIEPVRMVAVNEDWSALRFRKVAFIKTLQRNEKMILSIAGKEKRK